MVMRSKVPDSNENDEPTFTESFERNTPRSKIWVIIIVVVIAASFISLRILRPNVRKKPADTLFLERFEASLKPHLYPVVWRAGLFLGSRFNEDFSEWTLTISSSDWYRRDQSSKKDLVALVWNAYRATRERAGGNPDEGVVVIKTEKGEKVAEASTGGIKIHR